MSTTRSAEQLARLLDTWESTGRHPDLVLQHAIEWLERGAPFDDVCELVRELESNRAVHPLALVLHVLRERPGLLPSVRFGDVFENRADLVDEGVRAREPRVLHVPRHLVVRRLAVLGDRPGAAFFPARHSGDFVMQVVGCGHFRLIALAVVVVQLGELKRPTTAYVVEELPLVVHPGSNTESLF